MSLEDKLAQLAAYQAADEPDYEPPRTEWDGTRGFIQTGPMPVCSSVAHDEILRQFGYDPSEVGIVGNPRISRWQQRSAVRDPETGRRTGEFETSWLQAYKFSIAVRVGGPCPDIGELVAAVKAKPAPATGDHWFVFQAGDLQLGKKSQTGSTAEIVERYLESVVGAKREFKALKSQGIAGIQLSFPGDCLEGVVSQSARNLVLTEGGITEQVRIFRRLLFETIKTFAPLAPEVIVTVVNGNHDQANRAQNYWPGDGWATEAAIAVADQLEMNEKAFGHVRVMVPDKWRGALSTMIGDTQVTVVHGHQWRHRKAMEWLANQAVNRHPTGGAQVLQHGHWHAWGVETNREVTVMCSPTFECASDYLIDTKGSTAQRGAAVYLMKSGEISRLSII